MNKIVNIVNFVRGVEPRHPNRDIITPVIEEIKLNKKYNFPNTFLLQYDSLINSDFCGIIQKEKDDNMEVGIWIECVRQLVEACNLEWRGAPDVTWDWHIIPGFLMAYTQEERRLMIDEFMGKFKEIFGTYPKTVGSWLLDSYSVAYMQEKYDIDAFLICREQYGIDAYTVWGGYPNQGYYPAKNNMMCPAQSDENMVKAPIFKMLGADSIFNYGEDNYNNGMNGCPTMEPIWDYGFNEDTFKSNMNSYYKEECMDFAYTTIGQENSFGWERIKPGLIMQLELVSQMQKKGEIIVQKVCDTGKWFKKNIKRNSVISLISDDYWMKDGLKSIWYACENYRSNLFCNKGELYFRDIYKFDERYNERYLNEPCKTMTGFYDNLPVVDGRLWNDDKIKSGLKFSEPVEGIETFRNGDSLICVATSKKGEIKIAFNKDCIVITKPEGVKIYFERGKDFGTKIDVKEKSIQCEYNKFSYEVKFNSRLNKTKDGYEILNNSETDIVIFVK